MMLIDNFFFFRSLKWEKQHAHLALLPLLQAEADRHYVRENRIKVNYFFCYVIKFLPQKSIYLQMLFEDDIMKNVPNWPKSETRFYHTSEWQPPARHVSQVLAPHPLQQG